MRPAMLCREARLNRQSPEIVTQCGPGRVAAWFRVAGKLFRQPQGFVRQEKTHPARFYAVLTARTVHGMTGTGVTHHA